MNNMMQKYKHIEESFFDIDPRKKIAYIKLHFEKPSDIFDVNYMSKRPILNDDFLDWITYVFDMIPKKYRIDLDIAFDEFEAEMQEPLQKDFWYNIFSEYKTARAKEHAKNRIAYSLLGIGTAFFVAMLLVTHLWTAESLTREIFIYVSDIATTVTFWEAMTILVVERKENRSYRKNLAKRFDAIHFHAAQGKIN